MRRLKRTDEGERVDAINILWSIIWLISICVLAFFVCCLVLRAGRRRTVKCELRASG